MSITRLLVIQPENKTLIATNTGGFPVDLSTVADRIRCNDSLPSENGNYFFKFISSTSLVVSTPSSVSAEVTVITDGSTYNTNIGGSGIDIIFQDGRTSGDELSIEVIAGATGRDAYMRKLSLKENFGSCTHIDAQNVNPRDRITLIYFEIPSEVKNVLKAHGVTVMGYKDSITSSTTKLEMYAVLSTHEDWVEGTRCGGVGEDMICWLAKTLDSAQDVKDPWNTQGCQGLGTDVENILLSRPTIGSSGAWLELTSNGNNLTNFGERILKYPKQNFGLMIRTEENGSSASKCIFHSSEYTTDKSLRPKMLFLYEEDKFFDSSGALNYATSIGSEDTFGGS